MAGAGCLVVALALMGCSDLASDKSVAATASKVVAGSAAAGLDYPATPARVRRMSAEQYANTLVYVFGGDLEIGSPFAPLQRTDGLIASGAAKAGVTAGELQQLQRSASAIAAQVVAKGNIELKTSSHRDYLVPCKPASETAADDACSKLFITQTGRLLYRRPLAAAKVTEMVAQAHKGATDLKDFYAGLATVIEGMLIDPKVLLIADTTEPDPKNPGKRRLDAYALASRLSFFLWNAAPDDALLKAAENGELYTKKGRTRIVDMMLASPRLEVGVRTFFDDMLGFDGFGNLAKDAAVYPMVTGATLRDAREQTMRTIIDQLITRKNDYRDLYTTRETFMSPALATVYQVQTAPGWVPYAFPEGSPRVGLLSQISFLALNAHPARSSPTYRGKALREKLLCQKVPSPPPNVDFTSVTNPDPSLRTARARLTAHSTTPACAGCHKITDPMGLALENFDGAGKFRELEQGSPLDVSGALDGKPFNTVQGLGQALHDHPALASCLVKRLYSYGTGGPLTLADNAALTALDRGFAQSGYRLPDLLRMIVMSDAFSEVVENPVPPASAVKTADASSTQAPAAN